MSCDCSLLLLLLLSSTVLKRDMLAMLVMLLLVLLADGCSVSAASVECFVAVVYCLFDCWERYSVREDLREGRGIVVRFFSVLRILLLLCLL